MSIGIYWAACRMGWPLLRPRTMATTVVCTYTFEAAHALPHVPEGHPCGRVHGHGYRADIHVSGPVDTVLGWVVDFAVVDGAMAPLLSKLDHHLLNEVEGLHNPTVEVIAAWLWQRLSGPLPGLSEVVVHESLKARCSYTGP